MPEQGVLLFNGSQVAHMHVYIRMAFPTLKNSHAPKMCLANVFLKQCFLKNTAVATPFFSNEQREGSVPGVGCRILTPYQYLCSPATYFFWTLPAELSQQCWMSDFTKSDLGFLKSDVGWHLYAFVGGFPFTFFKIK